LFGTLINIDAVFVSLDTALRDVFVCIDANLKGIALVVEGDRRLLFTITDGDLRRAILQGVDLGTSVRDWMPHAIPPRGIPVTAPHGTPPGELVRVMREHTVYHLPLLDERGRVVDLVLLTEFATAFIPVQAVVMAGGQGTRLHPLTSEVPKPMLPVGGRPLMEHIISQLRGAGIQRVSITTHYKPEVIVGHFGNGDGFGVDIDYVNERRPLGTAGSLSLLQAWESPIVVMNGDILSRVNHASLYAFHRENHAVVTVAVRQYDVEVPYGVVDTDGLDVRGITEKPTFKFFVNAGLYILEPLVQRYLVRDQYSDMTEVLRNLMADGHRVVSYPIHEYWLDVGRSADYERAQHEFKETGQ
jgi:dTDP-glucose pyrophosphorylase